MKNLLFKIWKWKFELKVSRIPNEQKMNYLIKYFWEETEKQYDLLCLTGTFKELNLQKFESDKIIRLKLRCENMLSIETDKY